MKVKKRIFLGLSLGGLFIIVGTAVLVWYFFLNPGTSIRVVIRFLGLIIFALALLGFLGVLLLAVSLLSKKSLGPLNSIIFKTLDFIYPLALFVSKLLKINKELLYGSYIEVYNQITKLRFKDLPDADKILMLPPHCLQKSSCPHKITVDINNCRRCGQCTINEPINLSEKYNVKMSVVTGGTSAREIIKKYKPQAVVAVACERDLASGVNDVSPMPVIGVLNIRPFGPCRNTTVDVNEVKGALEYFFRRAENILEPNIVFNNKD
ncbi:MAG TPA: hypothetical protein DEA47_01595 [Peptococcaceae bacterium]|nr:MAG: Uncharacterized protein XD50_1698 [Clostridia bacterium 41_269]HBT20055.1 hypothetical protein [Peptococcaceae bacterium]